MLAPLNTDKKDLVPSMHCIRFLFCCTLIVLAGCATTSYRFSTVDELPSIANSKTSTLPAYDLTGGLWLEGQPLYINKEFNFGMAMSIEGAGVAIAVGMRTSKNKALAEQLSSLAPLQLNERLHALLSNKRADVGAGHIAVYGILYGQPQAHLRTVLELYPSDALANDNNIDASETVAQKVEPERFVFYSAWMPATGDASWTANDGELLWRAFDESLPALVELIAAFQASPDEERNAIKRYSISGGEAVQRGEGFLLREEGGRSVIQSTSVPKTILSVPSELVEFMGAVPPLLLN